MIKINGIARRNLQEQVAYNADNIDDLNSRVKVLELVEDQTVVAVTLTEATGTLTEEELAILQKNNAIIVFPSGEIYVKGIEATGGSPLFYENPHIFIDETGVSQNYIEIDTSTREYVSGSEDYYPQASGGTQLYRHVFTLQDSTQGSNCEFYLISTSSQPFTSTMDDFGEGMPATVVSATMASGEFTYNGTHQPIVEMWDDMMFEVKVFSSGTISNIQFEESDISDIVTQL